MLGSHRLVVAIGVALLLGIAAIPAKAQTAPLPPSTAAPPVAAPPAAAPLVVATPTVYDTLDPHVVLDARRAEVRLFLYDGLYRWQAGPLRLAPWLAQSYTVSEDGKAFRFSLRADARFHDGHEVKASDVVYSVERVLALKRGVAPLLAGLVSPGSTKVIDQLTVEFNLARPSPLFLTLLSELHIVNSELLRANEINNDWGRGWLQAHEAGSGAYSLESYDATRGLTVRRNPGYWNKEWSAKPIERIELRTVLDPEERVAALVKGEVQVVEGPLLPDQVRGMRAAKDIAVVEHDDSRLFTGLIDSSRDPFKSLDVRRLVAQAFDVNRFIATTLPQGSVVLGGPLPPAFGNPLPAPVHPKFDIDATKADFAKLKVVPRDLTIGAIAGDPHSERAALLMLEGLQKLGLTARIVSEPWPVVYARMHDAKEMYDILFMWHGARYLDANNFVGEMYDCDLLGNGNASFYCNKAVDGVLKEARNATDKKLRQQGYEKAATMVQADQGNIFVATGRRTIAFSRRLKGLRYSPVGEAIDPRLATME